MSHSMKRNQLYNVKISLAEIALKTSKTRFLTYITDDIVVTDLRQLPQKPSKKIIM